MEPSLKALQLQSSMSSMCVLRTIEKNLATGWACAALRLRVPFSSWIKPITTLEFCMAGVANVARILAYLSLSIASLAGSILCNALIFVLQKHSDSFTEKQPMTASFDFFLSGLREFLHWQHLHFSMILDANTWARCGAPCRRLRSPCASAYVHSLMYINVKSLLSLVDRKSAQAPSGSTNSTRQRTLTPAFSVMEIDEIVFALRYSNLIHEWFESLSLWYSLNVCQVD